MTASKTKKPSEPSETQKRAMEIIRKAVAPQLKLRKTKESYPQPNTVVLDAYPPFSMREQDRATDSLEAMLDEAGIDVEEISVGVERQLGGGGRATTNIEVALAEGQ